MSYEVPEQFHEDSAIIPHHKKKLDSQKYHTLTNIPLGHTYATTLTDQALHLRSESIRFKFRCLLAALSELLRCFLQPLQATAGTFKWATNASFLNLFNSTLHKICTRNRVIKYSKKEMRVLGQQAQDITKQVNVFSTVN
jgi:hypothetical protein